MADLPHFESSGSTVHDPADGPWYRGMTRYHWFVLTVAALGWLFDCLDQQLFNLARKPAMQTLLATADAAADPKLVDFYGGLSTCIFMLGWATGGLIFGVVGDRLGWPAAVAGAAPPRPRRAVGAAAGRETKRSLGRWPSPARPARSPPPP